MTSSPRSTLTRFFAGITEQTFQGELGVVDPPLIDYLTDLLARFLRTESLLKVRGLTGKRISDVGQMLWEAEQRVGVARREVHRHIGDFTLFWTGMFPESLRKQNRATDPDAFRHFCLHGKQAYFIASSIETDKHDAPADVLQRLSAEFELCAYGLREVRREWESDDGDGTIRPMLLN